MPYTINKTNGVLITVVQDGTINNSSLDITLVGKNYSGYGEAFNENFVKLLENFSNATKPKKPLGGQLWFDSANKKINVYDGAKFKSLGVMDAVSTQKPSGMNRGDLWFNPTDSKLYAYNGVDWTVIGPQTSSGVNNGVTTTLVTDTNSNSHTVIQQTLNNTTATITSSADKFDLLSSSNLYNSFPSIYPGINLAGSTTAGVSAYINPTTQDRIGTLLWGTSASALGFVEYNNSVASFVPASAYVHRTELNSNTGTTYALNVGNDDGITIGLNKVLKLHITNSNVANASVINGSILNVNVNTLAGTYTNVISINGSNGLQILPNASIPVNLGAASNQFNALFATTATVSTLSAASGSGQILGNWTLGASATLQATYADLAERYAADAEYEPGTVLIIGGTAEVTTTDRRGNAAIAGIVSTNPAYTLNEEAGNDITHPYIALKGRVPCKVVGPISKGDLLVTSSVLGHAERAHANDNPNAVLGRALEDFEDTFGGLIEVMVA